MLLELDIGNSRRGSENVQLCTLDELPIGKTGCVKKINAEESMMRRLLDIGLIQDSLVKSVLKSPFGDPIAYEIRGAIIAIRNDDARTIEIEVLE